MGSTFSSLHYHIIFSTKARAPLITNQQRERLHAYVGGVIKGLGGIPESVGGVEDHIHILSGLKPSHCVSDFVRDLKRRVTSWSQETFDPTFGWQEGYAAFSVSIGVVPATKKYIADQEQHHKSFSYLDELRQLLDEAGIPYEERFLV